MRAGPITDLIRNFYLSNEGLIFQAATKYSTDSENGW